MESTASAPRGPGTTDTYSISSAPTLTLDGANFSNCSASVAGGGIDGIGTAALRVEIVIKNSTLSGSESVGGSGGGVAIADGILSLRQSVIESSTAAYGASIHASSASSVSLNSSTVRAGNATADGGGIFLAGASSVLLADGSLMADNVAVESGGALHASDSTVAVEGGTRLEANSARLGGGLSARTCTVDLLDTVLQLNTASKGGGMYAHGSTVRGQRIDLLDNGASGAGGGVAAVETSRVEISDSYAARNACPAGAGGALSLERSSVQLEQSTLEANTAGSGGAISISERAQNLATPLIRNVTFVANTAAAPASRGYIAASSSVKGEGGATYLSSAGTIRVEQSTFDSNRGKSGGALAAIASTTLELRRASVRNNSAEVNGGGVMVVLAVLTSEDDVFENKLRHRGRRRLLPLVGGLAAERNGRWECGAEQRRRAGSEQLAAHAQRIQVRRQRRANRLGRRGHAAQPGHGHHQRHGVCVQYRGQRRRARGAGRVGIRVGVRDRAQRGERVGRRLLWPRLPELRAEQRDGGGQCGPRWRRPLPQGVDSHHRGPHGASKPRGSRRWPAPLRLHERRRSRASAFESNNASESELVETTDTAAGTVEGGGIFCEDSNIELLNLSLRSNEAHSKAAAQGTGGGLAARACVGPLQNVDFDENVANQAGGVLWKGSAPCVCSTASSSPTWVRSTRTRGRSCGAASRPKVAASRAVG